MIQPRAVDEGKVPVPAKVELVGVDAPGMGDDVGAKLVQDVVPGPLSRPFGRPEAVEQSQQVKLMESDPSSCMSREMKLVDLSSGEEAVIKDVETDLQISLSQVRKYGYRIESVSIR